MRVYACVHLSIGGPDGSLDYAREIVMEEVRGAGLKVVREEVDEMPHKLALSKEQILLDRVQM